MISGKPTSIGGDVRQEAGPHQIRDLRSVNRQSSAHVRVHAFAAIAPRIAPCINGDRFAKYPVMKPGKTYWRNPHAMPNNGPNHFAAKPQPAVVGELDPV
jgi:hypothetical protein